MATDYIDTIWRQFGDDKALRTMAQMGNGADTVENRLSTLRGSVANGFTGAGAAGAALFASSLKKGMDAVETENLVQVTFGEDQMPDIEKWSKDLRKELSLNEYSLRRNAASFANLFQKTGAGQGEVAGMSKNITELSRDLASFYNTSNDEAVRALQGALVGETESIRNKYNVLLNDATISEYAWANGIAKRGQELTEQQKVLARYGAILQQTKNAQGDLSRTKDSPANLARAAVEEWGNIQTDFGKTQEKLMQTVLKGVHSALPVIESVTQGFSNLPEPVQLGTLFTLGSIGPAMKLVGFLRDLKELKGGKGGRGAKGSGLPDIPGAGALGAGAPQWDPKAKRWRGAGGKFIAADLAQQLLGGSGGGAMTVNASVVYVNGGVGGAGPLGSGPASLADDAADAAAAANVSKMSGFLTPKVTAFGKSLEGAAALGIGAAAVGATLWAVNDMMNSAKDMKLADEDYAEKRGLRGQIELDAARGASDNSFAKWWRGDAAAEAASQKAQQMDREKRERYKREGIRPGDDGSGYVTSTVANPLPPAVTARAARSRNARAAVSVNVDVPYGPGDYNSANDATSLLGYDG